jgi:hypothetical protein
MSDKTAMREMRRQFARLIAESPDAFHACVKEYQKLGPSYFRTEDGLRKNSVPQSDLVWLLAQYKTRPRGMTKDAFCDAEAAKGHKWGDRFSGGMWLGRDAIEKQLKNAQRAEKSDPRFASEVDYTATALREIVESFAGEKPNESVP